MEQRNITSSQHLQAPETAAVPMNLGACYVIDDNPENKDVGFDVTSDEKTEDSRDIDLPSDNDTKKYTKSNVMSVNKHVINITGIPKILQSNIKDNVKEKLGLTPKNKLKDSTDGRCSDKLDKTSADCEMVDLSNQTLKFDSHNVDGQFYDESINIQSGYEGDYDTNKDGESSGNVTDSDSETKKNLAEKAKLVIQKAIARLDAIKEELVEVVVDKDKESTSEESTEPGSSCTDTMVSDYDSTDLEKDTDIPKEILYKLLGKENKPYHMVRKCAKNTKRKLSPE